MSKSLQALNKEKKLALLAGRISGCRNSGRSLKSWCKENGICEQTYFRWQKRLFELTWEQQEVQFGKVGTPWHDRSRKAAVTIRIAGMEPDIHSGADLATVETVLRMVKVC